MKKMKRKMKVDMNMKIMQVIKFSSDKGKEVFSDLIEIAREVKRSDGW